MPVVGYARAPRMANRLRTWVRRVTPPTTRALARRVAVEVLERLTHGAGRMAETLRPALAPRVYKAPELEVTPTPPVPPVPRTVLAPEDLGWALARHLSTAVDTQAAALLGEGLRTDDHDPQAVRKIRVSARRLRSFAVLFRPWIGKKLHRRLDRQLKEITRALGPLRDLDVVLAELRVTGQEGDPLRQAAAEQIAARLSKRVGRTRKRAARAFRDTDVEALRKDLRDAKRRVFERLTGVDNLEGELAALLIRASAHEFEQTPIPTTLEHREAVHEVRILAKRLRYAHGWVKPAMQHGPGPARMLKRAQRAVGASRDLDLLLNRIAQHEETLRAEGQGVLAYALTDWRHATLERRAKADTKILPALADLSHRTLTRLTLDGLGTELPEA